MRRPGRSWKRRPRSRKDYDDPAGSGLKINDRRLTAAEIALRPIPFAEVTLSACSTGVRPDVAGDVELVGDDVPGLAASLLEAGAGTVIVSTTEAGAKASAAFVRNYYGNRLAGKDAFRAFADPQITMLADPQLRLRDWIGMTL